MMNKIEKTKKTRKTIKCGPCQDLYTEENNSTSNEYIVVYVSINRDLKRGAYD